VRPNNLAVTSAGIYWTYRDGSEVQGAPLAGGPATTLASNQSYPVAVATDGTNVYFLDQGPLDQDNTSGQVLKVPVGGGTVTPLASSRSNVGTSMATDGVNVYWVEYGTYAAN